MTRSLLPLTPVGKACGTITSDALSAAEATTLAHAFKALGDPSRVRLLSMIAAAPSGEACICDLNGPLELSQPTVSHHMKVLHDAGLVSREQRGRWAYFRVIPEALERLAFTLQP